MNRDLISIFLAPHCVQIEMASDGAEAVAAAAQSCFDVILMDMQMPVLDGLGATRRIRSEGGPSAGSRILALTANVLQAEVESCLAAGMDGHIGKPLSADQLISALRSSAADPRTDGTQAGAVRYGTAGGQRRPRR